MQKNNNYIKQVKAILNINNKKWRNKSVIWRRNYIPLKRGKNSTIDTKFDKNDNNISMIETSNEVDEKRVTKENNISFSRDTNDTFPSVIVETSENRIWWNCKFFWDIRLWWNIWCMESFRWWNRSEKNAKKPFSLMMREGSWYQEKNLMKGNINFHTTKNNLMWV